MGLLKRLAISRGKDVHFNYDVVKKPEEPKIEIPKYSMKWLQNVAEVRNYVINGTDAGGDDEKVLKILAALERRNGQCPCGGNGEQFKCPCHIMSENGICKCGIFVSIPPRTIQSSTTVEIKKN